jgi:hypothetical protein
MEWLAICRTPSCSFVAHALSQDDAHGFRLLHEVEHRGHTVAILSSFDLPEGFSQNDSKPSGSPGRINPA